MNNKIENLITQLTLEEKISMLAGADFWRTVPIKRLNIPAIKVTDGPNGARGGEMTGGPKSACFPSGITLAATWNTDLVKQVGVALAEEVQAKSAHILLAPTVNIHRSPISGRNFECYSEDPYLTARMAVAYINGLQSQGVGACIKHFVCNDQEFERQSISSEVNERALREIYLYPFQVAMQEAKPWAVMSAYNKVNGVSCNENGYLLLDILKGEWQFEGIVMSDWFGTYSPNAVKYGLDLEMPGPARWMGEVALAAVKAGEVSEAAIDDKVRRLLHTIGKAGAFEAPEEAAERAIDKPEHRRLIRQTAGESLVLLKNQADILPLNSAKLNTIAVIGANAKWAQIFGGGSASVTPHYVVTPLAGITHRVGDQVKLNYEIGCLIDRMILLWGTDWASAEAGGEKSFYGLFTATETGTYTFRLPGVSLSRLFIEEQIDGKWSNYLQTTDFCDVDSAASEQLYHLKINFADADSEKRVAVALTGGQSYRLRVEYSSAEGTQWLWIGCLSPALPDSINQAATLAAQADVAIVFAGLTSELESEFYDRPSLELPGRQAELIEKVAAANPKTIVVLNTGSAIAMPWLDKVAAVVQAWYPGQEAGNAIADVLFGEVNPSGKLPQTFPQRLADTPAYINYPGENGQVYYGEGIFVGYRYYDKKEVAPLFPFGYGLSYTTFAYKNLTLNKAVYAPGETIEVKLEVQNSGTRAGKEVVQLYVHDVTARVERPEKELKGFAKVELAPGETKSVTLTLTTADLSFYDTAQKQWVAEAGAFEVLVGSSSRDIRLTGQFELASNS